MKLKSIIIFDSEAYTYTHIYYMCILSFTDLSKILDKWQANT